MNLARNSFSLRKCQSLIVPDAVMSDLREGHRGLRFAQQRGLGDPIFRFWTSHSESSSLSRWCQSSFSGKKAQMVCKPSPHLSPCNGTSPGLRSGCLTRTVRDRLSSSSQGFAGHAVTTLGFNPRPLRRNALRARGRGGSASSGGSGRRTAGSGCTQKSRQGQLGEIPQLLSTHQGFTLSVSWNPDNTNREREIT